MAHWLVVALVSILASLAIVILRAPIAEPPGDRIEYKSDGWFRESFQWDSTEQRFLVSLVEGGIGEVRVRNGLNHPTEKKLVRDIDYRGNSTLGLRLDGNRRRALIVVTDLVGKKFSALAAYDTESWDRLFLTQLAGSESRSLAADVAFDRDGNAYVTDAKSNLIWKVTTDGKNVSTLCNSRIFISQPSRLPFNPIGLKGIEYHPDGYLLVIHTSSGALFKVSLDGSSVSVVRIRQPLVLGHGIVLRAPHELVVAGIPGARILMSTDGWQTANITHSYVGALHRVPTAATLKDEKVYVSHLLGAGFRARTFTIREAVFTASGAA